jgi:RNA polymerase sigma factor (sigma-70 family)
MQTSIEPSARSKQHRYVVAMVLGTALSTVGSSAGLATAAPSVEGTTVSDISRYCTACWRNARLSPDCWPDCTQDVFCRLLERVAPQDWERMLTTEGEERREFLRAIDAVKKRSQRARKWSSNHSEMVVDRQEMQERQGKLEREVVKGAARRLLSSRQQHILQMSVEGWSVRDIGARLCLSSQRVSDEKYKAIRKLRQHFRSEVEETS